MSDKWHEKRVHSNGKLGDNFNIGVIEFRTRLRD